jgi:uncharacterized protein YlbG (UPF0298 family)
MNKQKIIIYLSNLYVYRNIIGFGQINLSSKRPFYLDKNRIINLRKFKYYE